MPQSLTEVVRARVVDILVSHLPPGTTGAVAHDLRLGTDGLGFDSVAIVEILLECERQFDMPFPASLFDAGPLTVGRLVDHATGGLAARARR